MTKAIVLSGGGPVGVAWEAGILAGLAAEGLDVSDADLILGTSAGSYVGAQLALGRDLAQAVERFGRPESAALHAHVQRGSGGAAGAPLQSLFTIMASAATSAADPQQIRAEIGRFALETETIDEAEFVARFSDLEGEAWPPRLRCTAVNASSGQFVVWDESSGVELLRAVAASCAVPGMLPPITIAGQRYIDGGMRSGSNADLAKGHDKVLIVSLMAGPGARAGSGEGERGSRAQRTQGRFERELTKLRDAGSQVELVTPDAETQALIGAELMNTTRMRDAGQAGLRQGRAVAEGLRPFWRRKRC